MRKLLSSKFTHTEMLPDSYIHVFNPYLVVFFFLYEQMLYKMIGGGKDESEAEPAPKEFKRMEERENVNS